ncbi:protein tyrosine phosphatase receptor type C-associated protein [Nyctibius grandis]|uniref:protein tyrosine phosphatase receptor type C-associated protein n=1 Tax=Nyctibius grandis TaxID=48427 RepID=UPI0035BC40CB
MGLVRDSPAPCGGGRTRPVSPGTRRCCGPPPARSFPSRGRACAGAPGPAAARWHPPAPALLALAGLVAAGEPAGGRSDRAVGVLLGLLLCLALGLALAWHHLCRLSPGRYHPGPAGRRALALLRGRWHRLRGRGGPGAQPCQAGGDGAAAAAAPRDEEEELMPWSRARRREKEEEEEKQEQREDEDEDEQEEEEEEEAGASPPGGEQAAGGSAEALLSDLHAFSGTAAWGDARPHVTAL